MCAIEKPLFFTVVVPTYRRPRQLEKCLEALTGLEYPRELFEVIVVDDGSDSPPEELVRHFDRRLAVTLLEQEHAGPAAARNRGADRARGEVLAFTDDDCAPAADWLDKLSAHFAVRPDSVVGGRTLNSLPDNPYATASQLLTDYLYEYCQRHEKDWQFFASNNLAIRTEQFRAIGGFDTRSFKRSAAEDRDLCERLLEHGCTLTSAPEVLVHHAHDLRLRTYSRQHFTYGRGACSLRRARARRSQGPPKIEPPRFYLDMLRYPFSDDHGTGAAGVLSLLLAWSQVAHTAGFFWQRAVAAKPIDSSLPEPRQTLEDTDDPPPPALRPAHPRPDHLRPRRGDRRSRALRGTQEGNGPPDEVDQGYEAPSTKRVAP